MRDLLGLVLVAGMGALLAVQAVTLWRLDDRAQQRQRILDETQQALLAQTLHSSTLSGAIAVGLADPAIKDLARGFDVPPEEAQLHFARLRMRLPVLSVHVIDRAGRSMAQDDSERAAPGRLQVFQPYISQALGGRASVFAALEQGTRTRNLFYVAPVRSTARADSEVLGVVMLKTDAAALDAVLNRHGLTTLLLNPHGVAFSATRPGWRYAMTAPLTQQRIDAVRQSGIFAGYFRNGVASALPFDEDSTEVRVDGARHVVDRRALDWLDPAGHWQLVALDNVSALMTWRDRWWVASVAFALLLLLGLLALRLRRQGERLDALGGHHDVLREALLASPMAAVLTDADGRIVWANAQYERDSGYALAALRGQKPSLLASGQTPPATYRDLWSTLMAGRRWEGSLVNRDRAGQLHEEWVQIDPVFDGCGRRIAMVGWHQRRASAQRVRLAA
ncbi:PAS domain-containing protein [Comamonas endophytica]|uniref:PAS domain S-box protein n=1 Tax=Comamonas endophytica TaxID=2949090 RepID=A0ABY6G7J7_9BURK|nr:MULTISPECIES: PAS domain-containing protein [unclassified Acidovorax]MCD2511631.1 PAS domain S-box protein [Acidovorax sp. D4N7]UYG51013.1 PAS domain S-box protein [Acidovorax sp. 5MLIR]